MNISEIARLITPDFIQELCREDSEEAERAKAAGCRFCGGVLHWARYWRKPRGIAERVAELEHRASFCCAKCRRRSTPKSVIFLGRKVYLGACIAVAGILRGEGATVAKTCGLIGMSVETLRRWKCWWQDSVQGGSWWSAVRARVMPSIECNPFISKLFDRFLMHAGEAQAALRKLLIFISPLTVPGEYPSKGVSAGKNPQKMGAVFAEHPT